MSKQTFHLPTWRRKPTADEAAPDIADSELVCLRSCRIIIKSLNFR